MGELPFSTCELPHPRLVCRSERWQNAHQTSGGPVWRKTGKFMKFRNRQMNPTLFQIMKTQTYNIFGRFL